MAFSTSALSTWVKPGDLFAKSLDNNKTYSLVRTISGVKGYMDLHPFATTLEFQAGACSFASTNTTTVSAVRLTVAEVSSHEAFCVSDFNTYALGVMSKSGSSDHDDEAFVGMFMAEKTQAAANKLAKMFWGGSLTNIGATNSLALIDGICHKLIHTSQSASTVTKTSAVTVSNAVAVVNDMIVSAPSALFAHDDVAIFTTTANYMNYILNLQANNNYHFSGQMGEYEAQVFGTNIKIYGLPELDSNIFGVDFILTYKSNLVWGLDNDSENGGFDMWYSKDDRNIKAAMETKIGTAVLEPAMVVMIK